MARNPRTNGFGDDQWPVPAPPSNVAELVPGEIWIDVKDLDAEIDGNTLKLRVLRRHVDFRPMDQIVDQLDLSQQERNLLRDSIGDLVIRTQIMSQLKQRLIVDI